MPSDSEGLECIPEELYELRESVWFMEEGHQDLKCPGRSPAPLKLSPYYRVDLLFESSRLEKNVDTMK